MAEPTKIIDHGALKANQLVVIILSLSSFVSGYWPLAAATALVMAAGTIAGKPGFFPIYRYALLPAGLVRRELLEDNPAPHRFAQGFGAAVLLSGSAAAAAGYGAAGWTAVWAVIALAALNVFAGFCAGCFVYYWAGSLGLPLFSARPPEGTFPGRKPRGRVPGTE